MNGYKALGMVPGTYEYSVTIICILKIICNVN